MGLPLVVPSGAQLTLYWSFAGQLAINKLGCIVDTPPIFEQALADRLGSAIKAGHGTILAAMQPATTELLRVGIRDVRTANQTEFRDQGAPSPGTALGDALPKQAALCITTRTAQSGKSARGRVYMGGFDEGQSGATGLASAPAQTAAINFLNNGVNAALVAEGMRVGVMTRPQEDIVINETTTHADGTTTVRRISHQTAKPGRVIPLNAIESRDAEWETQRRRANGRGAAVIAALTGGLRVEVT